jgi:DNA polymerase II large subunit
MITHVYNYFSKGSLTVKATYILTEPEKTNILSKSQIDKLLKEKEKYENKLKPLEEKYEKYLRSKSKKKKFDEKLEDNVYKYKNKIDEIEILLSNINTDTITHQYFVTTLKNQERIRNSFPTFTSCIQFINSDAKKNKLVQFPLSKQSKRPKLKKVS